MVYLLFFLGACFVVGLAGVAANPAPFFGVVGLVVGVAGGCGLLVVLGGSFVGLVLFLIYLGGMLVVFAYSVALAAEAYPEAWWGRTVVGYVVAYLVLVLFVGIAFGELVGGVFLGGGGGWGLACSFEDFMGVVVFFTSGAGMLLLCVWGLLLTLFVVLEMVRGCGRGGLRVPY